MQAKCEELSTLKSKGDGIQGVHDLCTSRETELISQVERLQKDLNVEMNKHRLSTEVKENLDQTIFVLEREIQSLKERYDVPPFQSTIQIRIVLQLIYLSLILLFFRLQHKFITEQSIGDSVSERLTTYPPIFMPYIEGSSNNNSDGEDLMKPHVPQNVDDDNDLPPESSLSSLGELAESESLVVQTWRKGFRQALNEMDRS